MVAKPWAIAAPGHVYQFPRDHFEHPEYRTEWWYWTGNLQGAKGERYGFELVFFRQGQDREEGGNESRWRVRDWYLAHAAVTRIDQGKFGYEERLNRAGPGVAGASFADRRIWNGNWESRWDGTRQKLTVTAENFRFALQLDPVKPEVVHGIAGISQKAEGAGRASHYVTLPRLRVSGTLDGEAVHGEAWMDHEWFTEQLDVSQQGWDWFSAQFDDGTELMLGDLRLRAGGVDSHSAGTFIDRAGNGHHLTAKDFRLTPTEYWKSATTAARYPIAWRVAVPAWGVEVECRAAVRKQELVTKNGGNSYWEGAVVYQGSKRGRGYLEMTGYDKPISFQ